MRTGERMPRGWRARVRRMLRDDAGSSPVEFVLVGTLLTVLTLSVLQIAVAVYVRNVLHDAAVEGAHQAALADSSPAEGIVRTKETITRAVGAMYADDVTASMSNALGAPTIEIQVRAMLPVFGLLGVPEGLEVSGRAPIESFDD